MGLFHKKSKEITMRIYKTNQQAHSLDEISETLPPVEQTAAPDLEPYAEGIWKKCPSCASVLYGGDLDANYDVCTRCGHHFRLTARERIAYTADDGSFEEFNQNLAGTDPLDFPGYLEKLNGLREKTGDKEAIITGACTVGGNPCVLAVMDGFFMMGSMGAAVGEKFTLAAERALRERIPLVAFTVSGGARMQEGLISLMQMSKTAAVLGKLDEAGILYAAVLTDPTTGGVSASFAMLGDITLAEPNAIIGFAGRRVIEQTVKQTLPPNFQKTEFQMEKGFIDAIVERRDMRAVLANILSLHAGGGAE